VSRIMGDILSYIIFAVIGGCFLFLTISRMFIFLHMLQLEGYKTERFAKWLTKNYATFFAIRKIQEPKKKLVFTARATRVFLLTLSLSGMALFILSKFTVTIFLLGSFLITAAVPLILIFANIFIYPLEKIINTLYLISAKKQIRHVNLNVIAITGSYGKTSTKDILAHILATRYKVLKTPGSFNTPMGLCKVIRGELKPDHEIFIVEMGARQRGDIKELCKLVMPVIGIITAIGRQHLEMFKSIENIMSTKYELIESLPSQGVAIFNGDDENCQYLADITKDKNVLLYGVNDRKRNQYLSAKDISTSDQGIYFLAQNSKGNAVPYRCKLLGRHNVSNILAAATAAHQLGMSLEEISEAVKTLTPTPHRLQLIHGTRGVTVIDDAFNANPVGAQIALEVLSEFQGGRKVLVTPGIVELGEKEYEENKKIGVAAAKVCDLIFLVGPKRTKPILDGLKEAKFPETNIFVEQSLKDATERFKHILKQGDIVLFENDLPDTYNE
jgi:UDP-N-acetylmuramoyl-tripeptide--D-alanyl-D-alanine ligase